jgi:large subunit ribosomal protein L9
MDVILFENVPNIGPRGSFASVAPGYFRNYLSPKGLAVEATEINKKRLQDKVKHLEKQAEEEAKEARSEAERLEDLTLTFELKAGEDDKLFGSVTNTNIAEKLAEHDYVIDRHRISISEPIKRLGMFTVEAKIHHNVSAKIKILVEKLAE